MDPQQFQQFLATLNQSLAADQRTAQYAATNGVNTIAEALNSGDWSGVKDGSGNDMPFDQKTIDQAELAGWQDVEGAFKAQQDYEKQSAERALAQKQSDYQDYLLKSGQDFQTEKSKLDQTAANQGVLFSGGRAQKEQNLQNQYANEQSSKLATLGRGISETANDFNYKYGNNAAQGLNQYYQAGGNTYNAGVATGGVGSSGLSSVYNARNPLYTGTTLGSYKAAGRQNAASRLWNTGNKLMQTGFNNQR